MADPTEWLVRPLHGNTIDWRCGLCGGWFSVPVASYLAIGDDAIIAANREHLEGCKVYVADGLGFWGNPRCRVALKDAP